MCPPGSATQISCAPGNYQSLHTQVSKDIQVKWIEAISTAQILKFLLLKLIRAQSGPLVGHNQYWLYYLHDIMNIDYVVPYQNIWGCFNI